MGPNTWGPAYGAPRVPAYGLYSNKDSNEDCEEEHDDSEDSDEDSSEDNEEEDNGDFVCQQLSNNSTILIVSRNCLEYTQTLFRMG